MTTSPYLRWIASIPAQLSREGGHEVVGPLVYATSLSWDLLAHNSAFTEMFVGGMPPENTFKWITQYGRDQLPEHDSEWLGLLLPQLRGLRHRYCDDPDLAELEQWCLTTPEIASAWPRARLRSVQTPDGDIRPLIHARYGPGAVEIGVLTTQRNEDRVRVFMMDFHIGVTAELVRSQRFKELPSTSTQRRR